MVVRGRARSAAFEQLYQGCIEFCIRAFSGVLQGLHIVLVKDSYPHISTMIQYLRLSFPRRYALSPSLEHKILNSFVSEPYALNPKHALCPEPAEHCPEHVTE